MCYAVRKFEIGIKTLLNYLVRSVLGKYWPVSFFFFLASLWTSPHKLAKTELDQRFPSTDLTLVQQHISFNHLFAESKVKTALYTCDAMVVEF